MDLREGKMGHGLLFLVWFVWLLPCNFWRRCWTGAVDDDGILSCISFGNRTAEGSTFAEISLFECTTEGGIICCCVIGEGFLAGGDGGGEDDEDNDPSLDVLAYEFFLLDALLLVLPVLLRFFLPLALFLQRRSFSTWLRPKDNVSN